MQRNLFPCTQAEDVAQDVADKAQPTADKARKAVHDTANTIEDKVIFITSGICSLIKCHMQCVTIVTLNHC